MFFPTAEFRNKDKEEYIKRQKERAELKKQQEEKIKEVKKDPYEEALDKHLKLKEKIDLIEIGSPRSMDYIKMALLEIGDLLEFCIKENKPEIKAEE